jgi:hypothetical protein
VLRSIPTTLGGTPPRTPALERVNPVHIGLLFVFLALCVYLFSHPSRSGSYNHFVWQADAFLDGRVGISYPVETGPHTNAYLQDVMPLPSDPGEPSRGLLPFPPLPAVLLMPFVALFGLATDSQLIGVAIGAINVGLAWRLTTRLTADRGAAVLATVFFAFGTVHWYAAMLSTTWFLAHVIAITFLLLSISLALDAEQRERVRAVLRPAGSAKGRGHAVAVLFEDSLFLAWYRRLRAQIDPMQFAAGFVFGVAGITRLTVLFAAPFYLFVGGGGSIWRRGFSAGLGAIIPVALLLAYNVIAIGHVFNPAYEFLYQTEYLGYMPPDLAINREYGIEDVRHVPVNLLIMFLWPPIVPPECLGTFANCAQTKPSPIGMSILLTSPAYLLGVAYIVRHWRERIVIGSVLAIVIVAFLNLMHFSQGWVQFGYRFSNDLAPFATILVALGIARLGTGWLTLGLITASIAVNAWGVYWGVTLGW